MTAIRAPAPARIASPPGGKRRSCRGLAANVGRPFPAAPAPGIARSAGTNAGRPRTADASATDRPDLSAAPTPARSAGSSTLSIPVSSDIAQPAPPMRPGKTTGSKPAAGTPKMEVRQSVRPSERLPLPPSLALSAGKCLSRRTHQRPAAQSAAAPTALHGLPKRNNKFPAPEVTRAEREPHEHRPSRVAESQHQRG